MSLATLFSNFWSSNDGVFNSPGESFQQNQSCQTLFYKKDFFIKRSKNHRFCLARFELVNLKKKKFKIFFKNARKFYEFKFQWFKNIFSWQLWYPASSWWVTLELPGDSPRSSGWLSARPANLLPEGPPPSSCSWFWRSRGSDETDASAAISGRRRGNFDGPI